MVNALKSCYRVHQILTNAEIYTVNAIILLFRVRNKNDHVFYLSNGVRLSLQTL